MAKLKTNILFVDYYEEWIETYKVGAISEVTLNKYYKTLEQLRKFMPRLKLVDLDRRKYQLLINWYAETHEKQTTMDFHHQVKSCIQDMFHDGLITRDPTHKCVIKGKESTINKKDKFLQIEELTKRMFQPAIPVVNEVKTPTKAKQHKPKLPQDIEQMELF